MPSAEIIHRIQDTLGIIAQFLVIWVRLDEGKQCFFAAIVRLGIIQQGLKNLWIR
jgi:hypothetical protein